MYAVVRTGGKQYRVEAGQRLEVERLSSDGADVELAPVLVVDGDRVLATPAQLGSATVRARVVEDVKGQKIRGFTYKSKSNQRRRWGHRQRYSLIEITEISPGAQGSKASAGGATKAPATKAPATKAPAKKAPATKAPATKAPATKARATKARAKRGEA
jgi:large subunit ribosomal protein L21